MRRGGFCRSMFYSVYILRIVSLVLVLFGFTKFAQAQQNHCQYSWYLKQILDKTAELNLLHEQRVELSYANSSDKEAYIRGKLIFKKMKKLITGAKEDVLFQTWLFHAHSDPAHHLFSGLKSLQERIKNSPNQQPVNVWLLINVLEIKSKIVMYLDLKRLIRKYNLSSKYLNIKIGIWNANGFAALHSKYLVIDGKTTLVTGVNSSEENNDISGNYDLGFVFKGALAHNITNDFASKWKQAISLDHCYSRGNIFCWAKTKLQPGVKKFQPSKNKNICLPILLLKSFGQASPFADYAKSAKNSGLLQAIKSAKKKIDIITPNLNVLTVIEELTNAVSRGVRVRIILSLRHMLKAETLPTRGGSNLQSVEKLYYLNGLTPFTRRKLCKLLQIKWYSDNGVNPVSGYNPPFNHAKYMNIDDHITIVGSSNLDNQSWINSYELDVVVDSKELSYAWKKQIYDPVFSRSIKVRQCGGPAQKNDKNTFSDIYN